MNYFVNKKIIFGIIVLVFLFWIPNFSMSFAHQSGCHRWHSCPSDSGSYVCGDNGYACQYPTYPSGGNTTYIPRTQYWTYKGKTYPSYQDAYNAKIADQMKPTQLVGSQTQSQEGSSDEEVLGWIIVAGLIGLPWLISSVIKNNKKNSDSI